jgi:hypothetical protein
LVISAAKQAYCPQCLGLATRSPTNLGTAVLDTLLFTAAAAGLRCLWAHHRNSDDDEIDRPDTWW